MSFDIGQEQKTEGISQKPNKNKVRTQAQWLILIRKSFKKRRILKILRKSGTSPSVIADEIKDGRGFSLMDTRKVWWHLKDMVEAGLVQKDENSIYSLTLEGMRFCDKEVIE